jgi:hypothetical protein
MISVLKKNKKKVLFVSSKWSSKFPDGNYPYNSRILENNKNYQLDLLQIEAPSGAGHLIAILKLIWGLIIRNKKYDNVIIGYNNMFFTVILSRMLVRSRRFTLYFLYSKWYTFVIDYKYKLNPFFKKILYWSDKTDLKSSDINIFDTYQHRSMLSKYFNTIMNKPSNIEYVHTDYKLFNPSKISANMLTFKKRVFFHGGYIPLQGTGIIVKAINKLPEYEFIMVGTGFDYEKSLNLYNPKKDNTLFLDYIAYNGLPFSIASSEVCLGGPFGSSEKAKSVITNKTFEYLAMNKKTIVGDTSANKELLSLFPDKKHLIYFCEINDSKELVKTIKKAMSD